MQAAEEESGIAEMLTAACLTETVSVINTVVFNSSATPEYCLTDAASAVAA